MNAHGNFAAKASGKRVYLFGAGKADGAADMKELLGGKGANLAEMASLGLPVPPGFTITTEVCTAYYANGRKLPDGLARRGRSGAGRGRQGGRRHLRRRRRPAARLGALGRARLDARHDGHHPQPRPQRRDGEGPGRASRATSASPTTATAASSRCTPTSCSASTTACSRTSSTTTRTSTASRSTPSSAPTTGSRSSTPTRRRSSARPASRSRRTPREQLWGAIGAVFGSWQNAARQHLSPPARHPRQLGHRRQRAGHGVRQPGRHLGHRRRLHAQPVDRRRARSTASSCINAQGEDVVAGIRTPQPLTEAARKEAGETAPSLEAADARDLSPSSTQVFDKLEKHYRDMQDIEFTIQDGKLWMLQTRSGKRTAKAAAQDRRRPRRRGADHAAGGRAAHRCRRARPAAAPDHRSRRAERHIADDRPAGLAGRGLGRDRVRRRRGRGAEGAGPGGDPGARRDQPRGHPRHARGRRHPHHPRRHDQPRRRGRPRHGPAVRVRRRRAAHRRQGRHHDGRRPDLAQGRRHHHRRRQGRGAQGPRQDAPARAVGRLRAGDGLGGRGAHARRARQRRHAARGAPGARLRRRGHRPVPHRAHVLRGEPHPRHARDDLRRRRGRPAPGAGQDPAHAARRLRGAVRDHGRAAGDDPPARPAAARVPAARGQGGRGGGQGARRAGREAAERASPSCTSSTRCWASAAAGSPSAIPRSPRCRRAPSSRRPSARPRRPASRWCPR